MVLKFGCFLDFFRSRGDGLFSVELSWDGVDMEGVVFLRSDRKIFKLMGYFWVFFVGGFVGWLC